MKNKTHSHGRRNFIRKSAFAFAAATAASSIQLKAAEINLEGIPKGTTILFQGDSITDAGRNKAHYYANQGAGMGGGYVYQIVSQMLGNHPASELRFYNRGISGHKVFQLANRWEDDCLQLKPDVLSILIGVNDFWHTLSHSYKGTVEVYDKDLRQLLDRTKKELPQVKLIMGEPFAVTGGTAIGAPWEKDFPAYREAAKQIAKDYGAVFIPYQRIFDEALSVAPVSYWCPDGVHPSMAGGHLMAKAWIEGLMSLYA